MKRYKYYQNRIGDEVWAGSAREAARCLKRWGKASLCIRRGLEPRSYGNVGDGTIPNYSSMNYNAGYSYAAGYHD